jgi:hypothetical protein
MEFAQTAECCSADDSCLAEWPGRIFSCRLARIGRPPATWEDPGMEIHDWLVAAGSKGDATPYVEEASEIP